MLGGVRFALVLVLGAAVGVAAPGPARADEGGPTPAQKQAIYAKPSVVRVVAIWEGTYKIAGQVLKEYVGGHGSGVFVSADGFIATNAHVVRELRELDVDVRRRLGEQLAVKLLRSFRPQLDAMGDLESALFTVIGGGRVVPRAEVVLPDGTKLPYKIHAYGAPVGQGKDVAIIKVEAKHAPNLALGDSDKVSVQDPVIALGYPGAADLDGLFDPKSQLEASITDGTVSAIKRTTDGEPVLQVTTPITHGNSGGPAINLRGEVIGLATFGNRDKVQGFNFLVAASTVKQFVEKAGAETRPSETQVAWRKALDAYWGGRYDDAIVEFEEVSRLFPMHSEAPRLLRLAYAARREEKGKGKAASTSASGAGAAEPSAGPAAAGAGAGGGSGGSGGAIAGAVIAVLLVGVGIVGMIAMKRRRPGRAAVPYPPGMAPGVVPYAPPGPPPGHPPRAAEPPGMMLYGRVPTSGAAHAPGAPGAPVAPVAPVAKTVAIGAAGHAPVAATAFGSLALGSLTCSRGLLAGQRFSLPATGLLIGRQPGQAQIVVNDSRASGKHVWIGYENGVLVAIDQGTTNGTFVNDVRLGRISKAPLRDGDTVIVAEPDCLSLTLKLG